MTRRMSGWLMAPIEHALVCPNGHRIQDGFLVTASQCMRCRYKANHSSAPCGELVWVITMNQGAVFVASVTYDDVVAIKGHSDVHQTLRFLGAPMWGEAA